MTMHFNTPTQIRGEDYDVTVNPGNNYPFALIDMGAHGEISLTGGIADMRRLLAAAKTAVFMLERQDAPHAAEDGAGPYGAHCRVCGRLTGDRLHQKAVADPDHESRARS